MSEQQPLAWISNHSVYTLKHGGNSKGTVPVHVKRSHASKIPLYTQPQRTWVNLTNEEHMELAEEWGCLSADWVFYAAAVERKIKEKNNV
jgi:hypothetical protein